MVRCGTKRRFVAIVRLDVQKGQQVMPSMLTSGLMVCGAIVGVLALEPDSSVST